MKPGVEKLCGARDMIDRAITVLCEHVAHVEYAAACIDIARLRLSEADREIRATYAGIGTNLGDLLAQLTSDVRHREPKSSMPHHQEPGVCSRTDTGRVKRRAS